MNVLGNINIRDKLLDIIKTLITILVWISGWALLSKFVTVIEKSLKINQYVLYGILLIVSTLILEKLE